MIHCYLLTQKYEAYIYGVLLKRVANKRDVLMSLAVRLLWQGCENKINRMLWENMKYLRNSHEWQLHMIMALIGGYIGSYAIILRGNFGSAMTGNFLEITVDIGKGLIFGTLEAVPTIIIRLGATAVFGGTIMLCYLLKTRTELPMQRLTIAVEAAAAIVTALIPDGTEPILALYPVFFMSSFQWGTFAGADGFNCATIFSTNNFKQCITGWTEYALTKQEQDLKKGCFYGFTILSFVFGGLLSVFLTLLIGSVSILATLPMLSLAFIRSIKICNR